MRQSRWLKFLKDYDCNLNYHPSKVNVVANKLSQKPSSDTLATMHTLKRHLLLDIEQVDIDLIQDTQAILVSLT